MISFDERKVQDILERIKDAHDCADIRNDLDLITKARRQVQTTLDCRWAWSVDQYLRQKYPGIEAILSFSRKFQFQSGYSQQPSEVEVILECLKLDRYGILFDAAMKKALIQDIKEFISGVQ